MYAYVYRRSIAAVPGWREVVRRQCSEQQ